MTVGKFLVQLVGLWVSPTLISVCAFDYAQYGNRASLVWMIIGVWFSLLNVGIVIIDRLYQQEPGE